MYGNRNSHETKSGFTLVELSIVLVIIGLLIGGILVGQSMVDSARARGIMSEMAQYEVAIVQFSKKFKQMPGDSSYFTPRGVPNWVTGYGDANGNGVADAGDEVDCNGEYSNEEAYYFWPHLSQAQMLPKTYQPFSYSSCGGDYDEMVAGVNAPIIGNSVSFFTYSSLPYSYSQTETSSLFIMEPKFYAKYAAIIYAKSPPFSFTSYDTTSSGWGYQGSLPCLTADATRVACTDSTAYESVMHYAIAKSDLR